MKLKEMCLLCASAALLAACGGGGGGGSAPDTRPTDTVTQKNKPVLDKIEGVSLVGRLTYATSLSTIPMRAISDRIEIDNRGSLNVLEVDGKRISLIPDSVKTQGIYREESGAKLKAVGSNLEYARYGWYSEPVTDTSYHAHMFYQGYMTPDRELPTTGTAHYEGLALASAHDRVTKDSLFTLKQGKSSFDVDFGAKTVKGNISLSGTAYNNIPLAGNISRSDNEFGTHTDKMRLEGAFFGPKAEEMAGAFYYAPNYRVEVIGTFGASKK